MRQRTNPDPPVRRRVGAGLYGLLVVNVALLVGLGAVTFGQTADAQVRARGNYTMAGGGVNGSASGAVYIVDTTNQELIALVYDPNTKKLQGVGYRNLAADTLSQFRGGASR